MDQTETSTAAESFGERSEAQSPLARFILDEVEPIRDRLNSWDSVKSHVKLLLDAAQGRKLRPQKIGWTSTSTFTLSHSGRQVGGIYGGVTTLVSHQALRTTDSRELSRHCLRLSDVPHLAAKTFHIAQGKSAASFF